MSFKMAADIAAKQLKQSAAKLVHWFPSNEGYIPIDPPRMSNELSCPFCGETEHYTPLRDLSVANERVWICGRTCVRSMLPKSLSSTTILPTPKRALLWPVWCQNNGVGDIHHGVRFELIDQSEGKIQFLKKFADLPTGIILMQGEKGTGKTYASMALCELYTRRNTDVRFFTQQELMSQWLMTFKEERPTGFIDKIKQLGLLVIDDFGMVEPPPGFLGFFMDLINTRMQWTNRGTVITTNLNEKKMSQYCGEALSDRLGTAQVFAFSGPTRRKTPVL